MEIRRTGNFGFIDTGEGQLISFAMGKAGRLLLLILAGRIVGRLRK